MLIYIPCLQHIGNPYPERNRPRLCLVLLDELTQGSKGACILHAFMSSTLYFMAETQYRLLDSRQCRSVRLTISFQ